MKIIYQMKVKYPWNKHKEYKYMFDNYDAIEEWLDKHFKNGYQALGIEIEALALCDMCKEYKLANVSEIMKKHGLIYMLCEDCAYDYTIKIDKYIKEEEKWKK